MAANRWNSFLSSIADTGWDFVVQRMGGRRGGIEQLARDLLSNRGEASGLALARMLVETYRAFDDDRKAAFFDRLAEGFQCKRDEVDAAIDAYKANPGPATVEGLSRAAENPRLRLFRRINMAPDGIRAVLDMRAFILKGLKDHPEWRAIDNDIRSLLEGWFNPGFLSLTRIDWNSPASLLQRLRQNEKVHRIHHLEDLQRRLASDRRCFAFFHPTLPDEPLIFVQVALVKGISRSVTPLLEEGSPILPVKEADTAIFYSISACEEGLRGVTLGNFLIKRVVALLKDELPHIKTFSTLSPVPGLRRWIDEAAARHELATIRDKAAEALGMLEQDDWQQDETARERWLELCAHYLIREKRGAMKRLPLDPVARFHLGNGARLERINWQGDLSENGMAQSAGILVNYLYDEGAIEHNHEALINTGHVAHSGPVRKLLPALPKSQDKEAARSEAKNTESASAA